MNKGGNGINNRFVKVDARLKDLRNQLKDLTTAYAKSEDDLKVMSATVSFLRRYLP